MQKSILIVLLMDIAVIVGTAVRVTESASTELHEAEKTARALVEYAIFERTDENLLVGGPVDTPEECVLLASAPYPLRPPRSAYGANRMICFSRRESQISKIHIEAPQTISKV